MKSSKSIQKAAVVGSGISGIAAAYFLLKQGYVVDIIESSDCLGGRIGSAKLGNKRIDFGGKNIGYNYKLFREFVSDQGKFNYEYFGVNTSKVVSNKIVPINREKNLNSLINILKLANPIDLIKLFYLARRIKNNSEEGFLNSPFYNKLSVKLDHKNLSNYFSSRCCDNIIRPMTVRMNGSEPNECFIGNFGSNVSTAFDKYDQISEGMGSVIDCFASKVFVRLSTKVNSLIVQNEEIKGIDVTDASGNRSSLSYDKVIVSIPAYAASDVVKSSIPRVCEYLNNIRYNPVSIMIAKYDKPVFNSDIRAIVFDNNCPLSNAGAYGSQDLDLVRYTFSGIAAREKINKNSSKEDLLEIIERVMPVSFNIKNNKTSDQIYRHFDKGLCSYSPYHHRNINHINEAVLKIKGLALTGDYFYGASIEACFKSSKIAVEFLSK
jgi:oxygen-dependent protoporphyrinogen oxidase